LKNLSDLHLILERIDLQFIKKLGLGGTNLISGNNNLLGGDDINLSLDNLCLDLKVTEERGLLWIKTGWSSWDLHICWGDHSWFSWGWSLLEIKDGFHLSEITVGEDKVDVSLKLKQDLLDVGVEDPGLGSLSVVLIGLLWLGVGSGKGGLHEGLNTFICQ
jgi:hypothetical protein